MYKYREFGFNIESYREILEAPVSDFEGEPDVVIYEERFSKDYDKLFENMNDDINQMSTIDKDEIVIAHKNYGLFVFREGKKIGCQLLGSCTAERFTIFINCFALAHLMIQRKEVAIHGTGLEYKGKGIIISGFSGAGKSSIAQELIERGCGFLSDDLIRIRQIDDVNYMCPANPERKLCFDTAEKYNYDITTLRRVIDEDREKYYLKENDNYIDKLMKAQVFIILDVDDIKEVKYEEITGGEKIKQIMECLFRLSAYKEFGQEPALFMRMMSLANQISLYKITRPREGDTIAQRADFILDIVDNI
ncbi:AAA family ATPase [Butyrivibrio sp. TB]|uniref:AAA family ATPase n=1 Tax=Butyrivibrio sp. TB TaxID=1520809 RepID=UPI0008C20365|nr:AAA family ATPase [Butyrivibrio sp. TB]SEQ49359.1 HPr Serine kinase C-terminal domain-containing protein [Butyrivibrio sp. TB]